MLNIQRLKVLAVSVKVVELGNLYCSPKQNQFCECVIWSGMIATKVLKVKKTNTKILFRSVRRDQIVEKEAKRS